jgi:hypothetical protein
LSSDDSSLESDKRSIYLPEISANEDFFCEPTEFEGGFSLPPLIKKGWSVEGFKGVWIMHLVTAKSSADSA